MSTDTSDEYERGYEAGRLSAEDEYQRGYNNGRDEGYERGYEAGQESSENYAEAEYERGYEAGRESTEYEVVMRGDLFIASLRAEPAIFETSAVSAHDALGRLVARVGVVHTMGRLSL
jgi:flagellar biosynthesis/type III secretory pathway protein FliH